MMKHLLRALAPGTRLFLAALLLIGAGCVAEDPGAHRIVPKVQGAVSTEAAPEASGALGPAERGRIIFTGKGICHACHGPEAKGTQIAPDLTDDEWLHVAAPVTQEQLGALILSGVPNPIKYSGVMPPRGGAPLTDEEVGAVAAYVFSLNTR